MEEFQTDMSETLITLTSDIVAAHVANNNVEVSDVPTLIQTVYSALAGLGGEEQPKEERPEPAVSVRASVKPDYIVCLEDGKKLKMLKRYLRTNYDMSPEEYRQRCSDLPALGFALGLSDGCTELRGEASRTRQADRSRSQAGSKARSQEENRLIRQVTDLSQTPRPLMGPGRFV